MSELMRRGLEAMRKLTKAVQEETGSGWDASRYMVMTLIPMMKDGRFPESVCRDIFDEEPENAYTVERAMAVIEKNSALVRIILETGGEGNEG